MQPKNLPGRFQILYPKSCPSGHSFFGYCGGNYLGSDYDRYQGIGKLCELDTLYVNLPGNNPWERVQPFADGTFCASYVVLGLQQDEDGYASSMSFQNCASYVAGVTDIASMRCFTKYDVLYATSLSPTVLGRDQYGH